MQGIISIFENLINIIKTIYQIIANFFQAFGIMLDMIRSIIINVITLTADLPPYIVAFVMATISITTIFIVIGRQGGKSE